MQGQTLIRDERKGDVLGLFINPHFVGGISGPDAEDLDPASQFGIVFEDPKQFVDPGRVFLAVGTVHAENLDEDRLGLDLSNFEGASPHVKTSGIFIPDPYLIFRGKLILA